MEAELVGLVRQMLEFEQTEHAALRAEMVTLHGKVDKLNTWKTKVITSAAAAVLLGVSLKDPAGHVVQKLVSYILGSA